MPAKITAKHLYKIFGDKPDQALQLVRQGQSKDEIFTATGQTVGVQDTSFEVAEGDIFVIMGLSGSGKSTLVRMINGLIKPSAGEMIIDGIDVANCSPEQLRDIRRNKVAMIFQHFALFPHKTVAENVAFGLKIKGISAAERRERALNVLKQVGLASRADSYPDELSGGMQQRVGLARGLAADPEILLMDEPFGALDPLIRREMQEELLELQRRLKKTIVFITHDLNEALFLGNKIAIMHHGKLVQTGTAEEIVDRPANDYVAAFTKEIDRSRVFTAESIALSSTPLDFSGMSAARAVAHMEQQGLDAIHIVRGERIAGIVTYRDASAALRDDDVSLDRILTTDFPTASHEAALVDLFPLAQAGLPIALTDHRGRLTGVIQPQAIFARLVSSDMSAKTI